MKTKTKKIVYITGIILLFAVVLSLLTGLVMPKYSEHLVEGGMISSYYEAEKNNDVIFVGDCEVYANINPLVLYDEGGFTSYIRGSSQQLLWQSYYVIEETLKYETPKAVVLNVNALRYGEPVKEEYHRLTMDYMRWSDAKVGMILDSMTEEESFFSYVFPILRYHSRITELTSEDFTYLFYRKNNTVNGHILNTSVTPMGKLPAVKKLSEYQFSDKCMEYMDKIRELCENNGVELVLMKAPSQYPFWYDEYEQQVEAYAETYSLRYYNFLEYVDEIGIDYSTDTYDGGLHLNEAGAIKLSAFFAKKLAEDLSLEDRRAEGTDIYAELRETYNILLEEENEK